MCGSEATMEQRKIILESCKYIDKIILNAPLIIDELFIKKYNITYVLHAHSEDEDDKYNFVFRNIPKEIFVRLDYNRNISTTRPKYFSLMR